MTEFEQLSDAEKCAHYLEMDGRDDLAKWIRGVEVSLIATQKEYAEAFRLALHHQQRAEKAEQALAAHNVAWDAVIQPCYDELKKALGRDIECPAYIPDAIKELAALALRGEPVAWSHPIVFGNKQSEIVTKLTKEAQPQHGFTVALYAAPISGEPTTSDLNLIERLEFIANAPREVIEEEITSVCDLAAGRLRNTPAVSGERDE